MRTNYTGSHGCLRYSLSSLHDLEVSYAAGSKHVPLGDHPCDTVHGSSLGDTEAGPTTWKCPEADGSFMYTNKERVGCEAMDLKPLSVVPDLVNMPTIPRTQSMRIHNLTCLPLAIVSQWGRDGKFRNGHVTGMRAIHLPAQSRRKSAPCIWNGCTLCRRPGVGCSLVPIHPMGRYYWEESAGASHSFYDNARYIALSRLFGTGFVPVGCF